MKVPPKALFKPPPIAALVPPVLTTLPAFPSIVGALLKPPNVIVAGISSATAPAFLPNSVAGFVAVTGPVPPLISASFWETPLTCLPNTGTPSANLPAA